MNSLTGNILLPSLPDPAPLSEAVLFAFDDQAFPFRAFTEVRLSSSRASNIAVPAGLPGSHDELAVCYGATIKIGDAFHMWYMGNSGPLTNWAGHERKVWRMCYATSKDGILWEKPDLGLVEFNGSKHNNIVDFPAMDEHICANAILHEPDEPDPARRFKMIFEAVTPDPEIRERLGSNIYWGAAFSPDGLSWTLSRHNPMGHSLEMSGITKHRGLYYLNGQQPSWPHSKVMARALCTFASADFEHWSPISALGLDRAGDLTGPSTSANVNHEKEVHLGAAMSHRGNVILGIYGMWNGHPSRDRRLVCMDLGLAISHDAVHFHEPIPDFPFIAAREPAGGMIGISPGLVQGQGMINHGDRTLYWFSIWRSVESRGVLVTSWPRDRFGWLQAFRPDNVAGCLNRDARPPHRIITCPIQITDGAAEVFLNIEGLGAHTNLRVGLVDEGFRPVPGCAEADAAIVSESGLRVPVRWKSAPALKKSHGRVRLDIQFEGVRPEEAKLYAAYVTSVIETHALPTHSPNSLLKESDCLATKLE